MSDKAKMNNRNAAVATTNKKANETKQASEAVESQVMNVACVDSDEDDSDEDSTAAGERHRWSRTTTRRRYRRLRTTTGSRNGKEYLYADGTKKDVDHGSSVEWKERDAGEKILKCTHCDVGRVLPKDEEDYKKIRFDAQPCGRLLVDMGVRQDPLRKTRVWQRMRSEHVVKCCKKRIISQDDNMLANHKRDNLPTRGKETDDSRPRTLGLRRARTKASQTAGE